MRNSITAAVGPQESRPLTPAERRARARWGMAPATSLPEGDPALWGKRPLPLKYYLLRRRYHADAVSEFALEWAASGARTPIRLGQYLQAKGASAAAWTAYAQLAAEYSRYTTAFRARRPEPRP